MICFQKSPDDFDADDGRRRFPQFSHENFPKILAVVDVIKAIGDKHGVSAGTVTLAWLLAQGVIPIPGTRSVKVCALRFQCMYFHNLCSFSILRRISLEQTFA